MLTADLPLLFALVVLPKGCNLPCPIIEISGPYTFEICREARQAAIKKYIMQHNITVWPICVAED